MTRRNILTNPSSSRIWHPAPIWETVLRWWRRRGPVRRLQLCESLALGDRRFVAVVQFEQTRFLIGGAGASLSLLAVLPDAKGDQDGSPASNPAVQEAA